ncbi:Fic family protein [Fangia hongkongensis]|uniref:Fic family protein n=1 Tax=Fangia hongkongensis TaxID=270495 RepID=UPI000369482E|nr:Fic family protein [Fangia hongkongensis]MBK2125670.1 Fic family protein [Fangia hongkongensis]
MIKLSELTTIQKNDLYRSLRVSITHHSNAIEGLTLTYGETKRLLESGMTAPNKPLHEQLVILGFADAFDFVVREAENTGHHFDDEFMKDIHAILFDKALKIAPERIERPIGAWRKDERQILGVDIQLSSPKNIDQDIGNLLYRTEANMDIRAIADFHINFERIHPFADGNGRVGRLLMAYQAIKNNYLPPLITNDHREEYLTSLNNVDEHAQFIESAIGETMELVSAQ